MTSPPLPAARAGRGKVDEGQAAVELALVLPLIVVLLLAIVQIGLVIRDQVLVVHAAREAARQAAVDASPDGPKQAAVAGSGLDSKRLDVAVTGRAGAGSRVRVTVRYRAPTDVPLVGPVLGEVALEAEASMRVEQ